MRIITKYLPPTDTRGGRIRATCQGGSITIKYRYDTDPHLSAAQALCAKVQWEGALVRERLPNGNCVFVFI